MDFHELYKLFMNWLVNHGATILIILVLAIIAQRMARVLARRAFDPFRKDDAGVEMKKRANTLSSLISHVLAAAIFALALVMILSELGVQIGPILAAAGVLGLAIGFGAQHLVEDIISGFFILMQDQIRVGDVVEVAGKSGLVEKVTLNVTVLRNLAGNVHYIRNGLIQVVTNMTKDFAFALFDIGVAYREDVDRVMQTVKEVDAELRSNPGFGEDILEPIEILGVDRFADSAVIIRARLKTRPGRQ